MLTLRKLFLRYRSISWLLMGAILVLTLLPAHYHLHHESAPASASHEHVIDFHVAADATGSGHHDDAVIFQATPDSVVKPFQNNPLPFLLFVFLLALLPIVVPQIGQRFFVSIIPLRQSVWHFTPPLRAPPRL